MSSSLNLSSYKTVWNDNFTQDSSLHGNLFPIKFGNAGDFSFGQNGLTLKSTAAEGWSNTGFLQADFGATYSQGYGLYSITASLDPNQGPGVALLLWPATNNWPGPELDLFESYDTNRKIGYSTNHFRGADGSNQYAPHQFTVDQTQVNTYSLDWEPNALTYYINGQEIYQQTTNVPKDAADGGENLAFGAEVTAAGGFPQPSNQVAVHIADMSYATPTAGGSPVGGPPSGSGGSAAPPTGGSSGPPSGPITITAATGSGSSFTVTVHGLPAQPMEEQVFTHANAAEGPFNPVTLDSSGNATFAVSFQNADDYLNIVDPTSYTTIAYASEQSLAQLAGTSAPAPTPDPTPAPSDPDTLTLHLSEDAWRGDASFTVSVDGTQVGGTYTATTPHGSGDTQALTLAGAWGAGPHKVSVDFTNDAYGGTPSTDRNLYLKSLTYDGQTTTPNATFLSAGTRTFTVGGTTSAPPPPVTSGSDTLILQLSEDAWRGDASFTVSVDGKQVGGTYTATTPHSSGDTQALTLTGAWGSGPHKVSVDFTNDAYGGTPSTDRNLYLKSLTYDGQTTTPNATFLSAGTRTFTVGGTAPITGATLGQTHSPSFIGSSSGSATATFDQTLFTSPGTDTLISGLGHDTLFIDARNPDGAAEVLNFHGGDLAAILGVDWNVAKLSWVDTTDAKGNTGATLDVDLKGTGHTDMAATFYGLTADKASHLLMTSSTYNGSPFVAIHG